MELSNELNELNDYLYLHNLVRPNIKNERKERTNKYIECTNGSYFVKTVKFVIGKGEHNKRINIDERLGDDTYMWRNLRIISGEEYLTSIRISRAGWNIDKADKWSFEKLRKLYNMNKNDVPIYCFKRGLPIMFNGVKFYMEIDINKSDDQEIKFEVDLYRGNPVFTYKDMEFHTLTNSTFSHELPNTKNNGQFLSQCLCNGTIYNIMTNNDDNINNLTLKINNQFMMKPSKTHTGFSLSKDLEMFEDGINNDMVESLRISFDYDGMCNVNINYITSMIITMEGPKNE